ncbi:MAG: heat-inducible transcriptional repressor HrcA [Vicinamibacterales bacterium]
MGSPELTDRSRRLLATLVREYIETGEAVASQTLVSASGLGVSSATIRSTLAQLEEAGYVHQPHTSAGRVPTDLAYRVFVDMLLEGRRPARPTASVEHQLRQYSEQSPLMDHLLAGVSHVVSRAARHVGFALAEDRGAILQRIEFVHLGGTRVLVVVVSSDRQVSQKVVDAAEEISSDDLVRAANFLNSEFAGVALSDIREAVLKRLREERTLYDELLARALRLARSTLDELPTQSAFHLEGAASLLDDAGTDGVTVPMLRALIEIMEQRERMVHLLNQYIDGPGLTVVIGGEHTTPGFRPFSLVAATSVDGTTIRTIGVIGPTRMHYSRALSLVEGTAQAVTRVLRDSN